MLVILPSLASAGDLSFPLKFSFASAAASGQTLVSPADAYSPDRGYGFEPGASPRSATSGSITATNPFLFSIKLPEGNYDVTVTFGPAPSGSTNTVKAESRRLMLERVVTGPGETVRRTFTVNIRTPAIPGGGAVHLKTREIGVFHWDDKLTLEFNGAHPALSALEITPDTNAVTLFLLGDSTVTDQPAEPWNSWGQMLTRFFGPGVAVANHAESGETLKGSLHALRVQKVLTSIKPGDYVFVQFGHNDMKDKATNALAVYKANLTKLVADVRARGATAVLVTSMERMAGVEKDTLAGYPQTVCDVAREQNAALIDLHAMSRTLYRAFGSGIKAAFQDGTHHNAYGSYELARCVVHGIRQAHLPLAKYLAPDVPDFDPAHPDPVAQFAIPASARASTVNPDGN